MLSRTKARVLVQLQERRNRGFESAESESNNSISVVFGRDHWPIAMMKRCRTELGMAWTYA